MFKTPKHFWLVVAEGKKDGYCFVYGGYNSRAGARSYAKQCEAMPGERIKVLKVAVVGKD